MRERILHMFNWNLKDIYNEVENVREQGFTTILVSPLQPLKQELTDWWLLYQPTRFEVGNVLGDAGDLERLCRKAHECRVKVVVDVVLHHVANLRGNDVHPLVDDRLCKFYNTSFIAIENYNDPEQCERYSLAGLPAINLEDFYIREQIFKMLDYYKWLGVDGFRYDAFKHLNKSFREELKKYSINSFGEVINVSKEQLEQYKGACKLATNSQINREDKNCVIWVQSHDDILNGWVKSLPDDLFIKEYRFLAKNYKADLLYYCKPFETLWKSKEIREINFKYGEM